MGRVLLTGASGFIAAHVLDMLLENGHSVRATVRSSDKAKAIGDHHPGAKLDFAIVEDIAVEGAFDNAVQSEEPFDAIIHTASPFHFRVTDPKKDLLDPAIIGTTGVLKAAKKYASSVKKVVITSSFASIINPEKGNWPGHIYSEEDWNPITYSESLESPAAGYRGSKTLAEKAAWDFMKNEKPSFSLATINPPLVFGPLSKGNASNTLAQLNTSNQRMLSFIDGSLAGKTELPPTGTYIWVDVRDVARAHIKAYELESAQGRFFITSGKFSNQQIVNIIRKEFPDLADKAPIGEKGDGFPEGGLYGVDNSKSIKVLGLEYLKLETTIPDIIRSLQSLGA